MLGERIKNLRIENGMKQKDLADKLFVTAQAVSRWENDEVEPSISTVFEIAKIFNVSIDELVGNKTPEKQEIKTEEKPVEKEQVIIATPVAPPKPVLAVCERCNRAIYEGSQIVRTSKYEGDNLQKIIYCRSCDQKLKQQELQLRIEDGMERRRKSFKNSAWITALILTVFFIIACSVNATIGEIIIGSIISLMFFPFIACLYLDNNCIIFIFAVLAMKVIKLPAIIFAFSLDGFIGFIVIKLIFAVISAIIAFFTTLFALAVCLVVSVFVYPFALRKNKLHPEIKSI